MSEPVSEGGGSDGLFVRNHMDQWQCKLCLTKHRDVEAYERHASGKRHLTLFRLDQEKSEEVAGALSLDALEVLDEEIANRGKAPTPPMNELDLEQEASHQVQDVDLDTHLSDGSEDDSYVSLSPASTDGLDQNFNGHTDSGEGFQDLTDKGIFAFDQTPPVPPPDFVAEGAMPDDSGLQTEHAGVDCLYTDRAETLKSKRADDENVEGTTFNDDTDSGVVSGDAPPLPASTPPSKTTEDEVKKILLEAALSTANDTSELIESPVRIDQPTAPPQVPAKPASMIASPAASEPPSLPEGTGAICETCGKEIMPGEKRLRTPAAAWHKDCFLCAWCDNHFASDVKFMVKGTKPYHIECNKQAKADAKRKRRDALAAAAVPTSSEHAADESSSELHNATPDADSPLRPGWEIAHDEEGYPYYYNVDTGETSWERPVVLSKNLSAKFQAEEAEPSASITDTGDSDDEETDAAIANRPQRHRIVAEILETEQIYVHNLYLVVREFLMPLRQRVDTPQQIVRQDQLDAIFTNCEDIYNLNIEFLDALEARLGEQCESFVDEGEAITTIGDIFLDHISKPEFVSAYTEYVERHDSTIETVNATAKSSSKKAWLAFHQAVRERGHVGRLDLLGFLIQPVQRVPRYELLLRDLIKQTDASHQDFLALTQAVAAIQKISTNVNDRLRRQADFERILEIERQTGNIPKKPRQIISVFGRREVRSGVLTKISRKSDTKRMLFLFRDTKEARTEVARLEAGGDPRDATGTRDSDMAVDSFCMLVCDSSNVPVGHKYKFYRWIDNCRLNDMPDSDGLKHAFQVLHASKSFAVRAEDAEEKAAWLRAYQQHRPVAESKRPVTMYVGTGSNLNMMDDETGEAPVWIPDHAAKFCMICTTNFNMVRRRHHCRNCGKVVCGSCSRWRLKIDHIDTKKDVRVCTFCFELMGGDTSQASRNRDDDDEHYETEHTDNHSHKSSKKEKAPKPLKKKPQKRPLKGATVIEPRSRATIEPEETDRQGSRLAAMGMVDIFGLGGTPPTRNRASTTVAQDDSEIPESSSRRKWTLRTDTMGRYESKTTHQMQNRPGSLPAGMQNPNAERPALQRRATAYQSGSHQPVGPNRGVLPPGRGTWAPGSPMPNIGVDAKASARPALPARALRGPPVARKQSDFVPPTSRPPVPKRPGPPTPVAARVGSPGPPIPVAARVGSPGPPISARHAAPLPKRAAAAIVTPPPRAIQQGESSSSMSRGPQVPVRRGPLISRQVGFEPSRPPAPKRSAGSATDGSARPPPVRRRPVVPPRGVVAKPPS